MSRGLGGKIKSYPEPIIQEKVARKKQQNCYMGCEKIIHSIKKSRRKLLINMEVENLDLEAEL